MICGMRAFSKQLSLQNNIVRSIGSIRQLLFNVEVLICILLIAIIAGIAAAQYQKLLFKSRQAQLFTILPYYKNQFVLEHAITGRWPKNSESKTKVLEEGMEYSALSITNSYFSQGNFAISFADSERNEEFTLAYRLVHNNELQPSLHWACGNASSRPDEAIRIPNITDLPNEMLFHTCK